MKSSIQQGQLDTEKQQNLKNCIAQNSTEICIGKLNQDVAVESKRQREKNMQTVRGRNSALKDDGC